MYLPSPAQHFFLNSRLNAFLKRGVWICGRLLSSARWLLLIFPHRASPSLSLSLGDMITAAPHQSRSAVACPTFNVNMGEVAMARLAKQPVRAYFLSHHHHHQAPQTLHKTLLSTAAAASLTYYSCQSNTPETTFHKPSGSKKFLNVKSLLKLSAAGSAAVESRFLLAWPELTPSHAFTH